MQIFDLSCQNASIARNKMIARKQPLRWIASCLDGRRVSLRLSTSFPRKTASRSESLTSNRRSSPKRAQTRLTRGAGRPSNAAVMLLGLIDVMRDKYGPYTGSLSLEQWRSAQPRLSDLTREEMPNAAAKSLLLPWPRKRQQRVSRPPLLLRLRMQTLATRRWSWWALSRYWRPQRTPWRYPRCLGRASVRAPCGQAWAAASLLRIEPRKRCYV